MFKFSQQVVQPLKLNIENQTYKCFPQSLVVKRGCENFTKKIHELQDKLKEKNISEEDAISITFQICEVMADFINILLGQGSYEQIFANRNLNLEDHQELICYLMDEINEFCRYSIISEHTS